MVDAVSERSVIVDYTKNPFLFYLRARETGEKKEGKGSG